MAEPYVIGRGRQLGDLEFTLNGHTYRVDANPDIDLIGTLLHIEQVILGLEADENLPPSQAVVEGKRLLVGLMRERTPDAPDEIAMGAADLLEIIALLSGGESAADAVTTLMNQAAKVYTEASGVSEAELAAEAGPDGEDVPLRSRSKGSSSKPGTRTGGGRATGKASRSASSKRTTSKRRAA